MLNNVLPIIPQGFEKLWRRLTRRCIERLNEAEGLLFVQANHLALFDDFASVGNQMLNRERGNRTAFQNGGAFNERLVPRAYPGNEAFRFFSFRGS